LVNRKFLYWGVFLVAAGTVTLIAQTGAVESQVAAEWLRWWPILVIGLGVGLLLRHTRLSLAGGMLAAAMPGLLLGGIVVAAPDMKTDCRITEPATYATRNGTFGSAASVSVRLDCGDLSVTTVPGSGWQVETGDSAAKAPVIDVSADRLSVVSASRGRFPGFRGGDAFRLSLPAATTLDLTAEVNAGRGRFDLAGGRFGRLELDVNAGESEVDLTGATVAQLAMDVNAASATVRLPGGSDLGADFDVNAAKLVVCAPDSLGLRIREETTLGSSHFTGLVRRGGAWESPDYATATYQADVSVTVNVGSVDVNPVGGCK
jgi:hypothetical protein